MKSSKFDVSRNKRSVCKTYKRNVKTIYCQNDCNSIKEGIFNEANATLKNETLRPRKPSITQQILNLIKKKNNYKKDGNYQQYQKTKNYITTKCREAKEIWMKVISKEIEDKISKGKMDRAYDIVKLTSFQNITKSSIVKNKKGELLIDTEDISDR